MNGRGMKGKKEEKRPKEEEKAPDVVSSEVTNEI